MSTLLQKKRASKPPAAVPALRAVRPKIVDVAREAGVSATTVSHALNNRGQVDPKTRDAVKRVAERLGYRPNRSAQRLRGQASNVIALASSMPFSVSGGSSRLGFMMEIAAAAASVALERGLALVLVPPSASGGAALETLDLDGAIVIEPAEADPQMTQLLQRGIPVVSIGRPAGPSTGASCVDLRSEDTTTQLLEHLRLQGSRRIALVVGRQRRTPYLDALSAFDAFSARRRTKQIIAFVDENLGEMAGRFAVEQLLGAHPELDAICAPVDAIATGVVNALMAMGRTVPGDVMVATRYDGPRARECIPPLTALNLHLDQVAMQAIELLLELLNGQVDQRQVFAPRAALIGRRSTAM